MGITTMDPLYRCILICDAVKQMSGSTSSSPSPAERVKNGIRELVEKKPAMKELLVNILNRTDLDDSQRVELILEIIAAEKILVLV